MNTLALLEVAVGRSREEMNALALIERRHRHAWSPSGGRGRVPLFCCMVAFAAPLNLSLDAITLHRSSVLWFAARSASKPGFPTGGGGSSKGSGGFF